MKRLKNAKVTGKDEITGQMIKIVSDLRGRMGLELCNMAFESGVVVLMVHSIMKRRAKSLTTIRVLVC